MSGFLYWERGSIYIDVRRDVSEADCEGKDCAAARGYVALTRKDIDLRIVLWW